MSESLIRPADRAYLAQLSSQEAPLPEIGASSEVVATLFTSFVETYGPPSNLQDWEDLCEKRLTLAVGNSNSIEHQHFAQLLGAIKQIKHSHLVPPASSKERDYEPKCLEFFLGTRKAKGENTRYICTEFLQRWLSGRPTSFHALIDTSILAGMRCKAEGPYVPYPFGFDGPTSPGQMDRILMDLQDLPEHSSVLMTVSRETFALTYTKEAFYLFVPQGDSPFQPELKEGYIASSRDKEDIAHFLMRLVPEDSKMSAVFVGPKEAVAAKVEELEACDDYSYEE